MPEPSAVEGEVRALRQEVAELRNEQRRLLQAVEEMSRTFRSLATQLGIASEPYGRRGSSDPNKEIPGFG